MIRDVFVLVPAPGPVDDDTLVRIHIEVSRDGRFLDPAIGRGDDGLTMAAGIEADISAAKAQEIARAALIDAAATCVNNAAA